MKTNSKMPRAIIIVITLALCLFITANAFATASAPVGEPEVSADQNLPTVITKPSKYAGVLSGEIIADGGSSIIDHGFYRGTNPNDLTLDISLGPKNGLGEFGKSLMVVAVYPPPVAYYKAYATNSAGTAYGDVITSPYSQVTPDLSVVANLDGTITATWSSVSDATQYSLYGGPAPNFIQSKVYAGTSTSFTGAMRPPITNVYPYYRLWVNNSSGLLGFSLPVSVIAPDSVTPAYTKEATGDIGTIGRVSLDIPDDPDFLDNYALVCDEDIEIEIYFSPQRTENAKAEGKDSYLFAVRLPNGETNEDIGFSLAPVGGAIEKNKVITYGDVNNDGDVTTTDATLLTRYAGGNTATTISNILAADVNGDACITTTDATLVTRRAGGNTSTAFLIEAAF